MDVQVRVGQSSAEVWAPRSWCSLPCPTRAALASLRALNTWNAAAVQPPPPAALPGIQLFPGICLHGLEATHFLPCVII